MGRSGELHLSKECSQYTGAAGDFCTITSSNVEEIVVGSRVVYQDAAGEGTLDTDIVLDAGSGNQAMGHVVLDLVSDKGVVTFSDGAGSLAGFNGHADVSAQADGTWRWEGTYSFD